MAQVDRGPASGPLRNSPAPALFSPLFFHRQAGPVLLGHRQVGPTCQGLLPPRDGAGLHHEIEPAARIRRVWLAPQAMTLLNSGLGLAEPPQPQFWHGLEP